MVLRHFLGGFAAFPSPRSHGRPHDRQARRPRCAGDDQSGVRRRSRSPLNLTRSRRARCCLGGVGVGMGFGLYEASFATVAGLYGRDARNAITGIALFAGFASAIGWPTSALLSMRRLARALFAWALLHLVVGLPLNRLLVPRARRRSRGASETAPANVLPGRCSCSRSFLPAAGSSRPQWRPICHACWRPWDPCRRRRSRLARLSVRPRGVRGSSSSVCCVAFRR